MNHVDITFKPPTAISLCSGIRGLDRGIARALASLRGFRNISQWQEQSFIKHAVYVEIESIAAYNLVAQMEQRVVAAAPVWSNVKTFPWKDFFGKICFFIGGYPCQPFSSSGKQRGVLDERHLWPYFETGIAAVRPVCCFFENVSNHINIGYRQVKHSLESLGYTVEEGIFSAEEVGAPHLRKRLFIMAVANAYCTEQSKKRGDFAKMLGLPKGQCKSKQCTIVSGGDCEPMGDANDQRKFQSQGNLTESRRRIGDTNSKLGEFTRPEGVALGNSFCAGLEEREEQSTRKECSSIKRAGSPLWPAPQGQYQHPWEPARLESRMDFTVDGYDFTEDLLRMAGNAVVEQTAEVAFKTLLMKFI